MAITQSRLNLARAAIRPSMWGRMLLAGPSGAGKTWTGLVIARTLVGPEESILVIDTEKESALTYADVFDFDHLPWKAPFDPRDLAATLLDAGKQYQCVIVDSFTHFWRGSGGTLDIANGKFTGWKDARPAQVDVTEAILEADCHVIACVRQTMDHAQEERNGKQVVVKLGMGPEQDKDFEYEVNVSIELDMQHNLAISKSRTNAVPVGRIFHAGHAADFATLYRDWLKGGEPVAPHVEVQALIDELNTISEDAERLKAKAMFLDFFGRPEFLLVSRMPEASTWVSEQVAAANGGPVQGAATEGADAAPGDRQEPADGPVTANGSASPPAVPAGQEDAPAAQPDVEEKYRQAVAGMTPEKVHTMLEGQALSTNGSPKQKADRLVKFMVRQSANAAQATTR